MFWPTYSGQRMSANVNGFNGTNVCICVFVCFPLLDAVSKVNHTSTCEQVKLNEIGDKEVPWTEVSMKTSKTLSMRVLSCWTLTSFVCKQTTRKRSLVAIKGYNWWNTVYHNRLRKAFEWLFMKCISINLQSKTCHNSINIRKSKHLFLIKKRQNV